MFYTVMRGATGNFQFAFGDVVYLMKMHDKGTQRKVGRPDIAFEVYKRASIILLVTAWESYIEDTIRHVAAQRIRDASSPSAMPKAFNACAQAWLGDSPKPTELQEWTGDGWRDVLSKRLAKEVSSLNTPNSENIKHLTVRYLGFDLTEKWCWPSTSSKMATTKLDKLIELRGKLVHRGKDVFSSSPVKRADVEEGMELVKRLVKHTDLALPVSSKAAAQ